MQGELVGDFWETDIFIYFRWFIENMSKSPNSISLPRIFPDTLLYSASDGESLRSVASLQLEFCMCEVRLWRPLLVNMLKVMIFMIFEARRPDLRRIFR